MAENGGYSPPVLESYSVESPPAAHALASETEAAAVQEWKITLHGEAFFERAMMPIIRIGNIRVHKYEITPDGRAIVCYLSELPEDGAEISVSYGLDETARLPQRFTRPQIMGAPSEPHEPES